MADAFEHIATTSIGSDTASVTFSSLGSYEHLQFHISARTSRGDQAFDPIEIQFNSDTGSNYRYQGMRGLTASDSTVESGSETGIEVIGASTATVGSALGLLIVEINDYANSSKKTAVRARGLSVYEGNGTNDKAVELTGGIWTSTAAITSVKFTSASGANFKSGSEFVLYGLSGS